MKQIWTIQPQKESISQIKPLNYLTDNYPNKALRPQFKDIESCFSHYRAVRGDGNCFYRAFAFIYLRQSSLNNFNTLFQNVRMICQQVNFQQLYKRQFRDLLKQCWQIFLLPISKLDFGRKQAQLVRTFNKSLLFDTLMIVYLRSLNYAHIKQNHRKYQDFIHNGFQNYLRKIAQFSEESQGVELISLPYILNYRMNIINVNEYEWGIISYNETGDEKKNINLLRRPGHYDIIYPQEQTTNKDFQRKTIPSNQYLSREHMQPKYQTFNYNQNSTKKPRNIQDYQNYPSNLNYNKYDTKEAMQNSFQRSTPISLQKKKDPRIGMKKEPTFSKLGESQQNTKTKRTQDYKMNQKSMNGCQGRRQQQRTQTSVPYEQTNRYKVRELNCKNNNDWIKTAAQLMCIILLIALGLKIFWIVS